MRSGHRRALGALTAVAAAVLCVASCSSSSARGHGAAPGNTTSTTLGPVVATIDMTTARGTDCRPPIAPGPGHPKVVLTRMFDVRSSDDTPYLVAWNLVPYDGPNRSYQLGPPGRLFVLQPQTGGSAVGYGTGTVTFAKTSREGTIDGAITLKTGGTVKVEGPWKCVDTSGTSPTSAKKA